MKLSAELGYTTRPVLQWMCRFSAPQLPIYCTGVCASYSRGLRFAISVHPAYVVRLICRWRVWMRFVDCTVNDTCTLLPCWFRTVTKGAIMSSTYVLSIYMQSF